MAWDDNFDWGAAAIDPGAPVDPTPAASPVDTTAAATPGLKAKSWGSSESGTTMPSWFTDWGQNYWNQAGNSTSGIDKATSAYNQTYGPGQPAYQSQMDKTIADLNNYYQNQYQQLPGLIDQQRQAMIANAYSQVPNMQQVYQPTLEDMSRRGILNSSVTGEGLGRASSDVSQALLGKIGEANQWAADQNVQGVKDLPGLLSTILGATGAASAQNTAYGQGAITSGANIQTLINQLAQMMQSQKSTSTQGSETYNV